jgi:Protein of unknown function (DUF3089)
MNAACRLLIAVPVLAAVLGVAGAPAPAAATPPTKWLCKPGQRPDPCAPGLKTTRYSPSGRPLGVHAVKADKRRTIDCFYVYPTVSDQKRPVATRRIDPEERSIALYQAARYSQHCRVYAPVYRQLTLQALNSRKPGEIPKSFVGKAAYADVLQAWRTYLHRYNHGRGVVIIGHSQGTLVLRKLVAEQIDPKPRVRRRLVSALLLGGNVLVAKGRGVGGDFQHIRACRSARQLGCVVAFSTFDGPVPADSIFGRTATKGQQVLCTNPAALGGGAAKLDPVFPSAPFAPGTTISVGISLLHYTQPRPPTPWVSVPGAFRARCSTGSAHVLQITPLGGAPRPTPSPDPTWGLHLVDANIALGNLVSLVRTEARAYSRRGA